MGAHQAVLALVFADIVGSTGRVIAVEGDGHNVKVAKRNVELNNAANVVIVEAACAAQPGRVSFHEGLNGHISQGRIGNRVIRAVTIDELADEYGKPDVVVLDIEGFELQALLGAQRTLGEGVTFVIEVHAGGELQAAGGTVKEIASMLQRHGYALEYLSSDGWSEADAELVLMRPEELPDSERFFLLGYVPVVEAETPVSDYA
jgi:FkbM family methyltransferase